MGGGVDLALELLHHRREEFHLRELREVVDEEGQIARRLASTGAEVTGIDPTRAQLRTAGERGGGPRYARAAATALISDPTWWSRRCSRT